MEILKYTRLFYLLILFSLISNRSISQKRLNKFILNNHLYRGVELPKYNRIGLTIGSTSSSSKINGNMINAFFNNKFYDNVSPKFDLNQLNVELGDINVSKWRVFKKKRLVGEEIKNRIISYKYGNRILENVFSPWNTPISNGGPSTIINRFKKNLTTSDVTKFKFTLDGLNSLMRDSIDLVAKNNYIIINDYKKIVRLADIYARRRKAINLVFSILTLGIIDMEKEVDEDRADYRDGWKIKGVSYLYKVNVEKDYLDRIWEAYFNKKSNNIISDIPVKIELIKAKKFKVKKIGFSFKDPSDKLDELRDECLEVINQKTILKFENSVNSFKIKRTIVEGKPLKIEVGTKEGTLNNQRYLVMQPYISKNKTLYKPIGAVRIKNVQNNDQVINKASDILNSSKCYQYQGKRIQEGMIIKQANELGIELGYEFDYNTNLKVLMPSLKISYDLSNKINVNQFRVYANLNSPNSSNNIIPLLQSNYLRNFSDKSNNLYLIKDYSGNSKNTYFNDIGLNYESRSNLPLFSSFGVSWEYNFLNNFFLRPEVGYSGHQLNLTTTDQNILIGNSSDFSTFNKISINSFSSKCLFGGFISPSISFYGGPSYNFSKLSFYGEDKKGVFMGRFNYISYIFGAKLNF